MPGSRGSGSTRCDRAQTTLLSTMWIAVAIVLAFGIVWFGHRLRAAGHAQGVADAVALAGASAGRDRADGIAVRNGAVVLDYERSDGVVRVVVESGGARAASSATATP